MGYGAGSGRAGLHQGDAAALGPGGGVDHQYQSLYVKKFLK